MRIPFPFLALLGLSVAVGAEANLVMAPSLARAAPVADAPIAARPSAAPLAADGWWRGFGDDVLDALVLAAQQQAHVAFETPAALSLLGDTLALPVEMQVAAAYVSARVDGIGLALIREALAAARREAEIMATGMASEADRAVLRQRIADALSAEHTLSRRRDGFIALLSARCGIDAAAMEGLMAPAQPGQRLPRFAAPLPEEAPNDWVFDRQDVVLAQSLRAIAAPSRRPDDGYLDGVLARAGMEISAAMNELQAQHDRTAALEARTAEARRAMEDVLARRQQGAAPEIELLERYQQLMLYSQQFTSASGTLALGWIKLLYRLQGTVEPAAQGAAAPVRRPLA